jgi:spermidine synthase
LIRLYLLFVLSGAAGLVLETVLLRQFAWSCGSSAAATALVLAAFMAGLALGNALFGPIADRSARPLRLYGLLELGIGLSGATLVWLLGAGRELFLAPLRMLESGVGQRAAEFGLAFLLVLLPTLLMGGTLPAVSRYVIRESERLAGSLGLLYGLNTLGAAVGVYLAGFHLIELMGVSNSAYLAAGINLMVGVAALLIDRGISPAVGMGLQAESLEEEKANAGSPGRAIRSACMIVAGISGLAVLGYEVVWTRLLSLLMRSFTYSFALMLSLFLLGLVLGALALRIFGDRLRRPVETLGWVQLVMGAYVAACLLWMPTYLTPVPASSFTAFLFGSALRASIVVLPPTILSGVALPLAVRSFSRSLKMVGRDVGGVYAVNTAGGIVGALLAGLLLLPWLGAPHSLALLASLNAAAGLLLFVTLRSGILRQLLAALLVAACAFGSVAAPERFTRAFLEASSGSERIRELLYFNEGATDTVAIVRKDYSFHDHRAKSLITNGFAMAATVKPVWRYMALEGHLPVLLAEEPRDAMLVGIGTGITLGAVASHPGLRTITAAELSDGVIEGLRYFEYENEAAYNDPRLDLVQRDGRHFLELTDAEYDLVTLEPPPPIVAGSVHLYSLDFYHLCQARLRRHGIVAQWLPLHAQSLASARMTASTFLAAFPHVQLWLPSVRDAVLVGSREPLRLDLDRLLRAYAEPRTRANLSKAYLESPESLLATFLLDRAGIERWAEGAPIITDERPLMEFFRHQGGNMDDRDIATLLEPPQADWSWVGGLRQHPVMQQKVAAENEALRLYLDSAVGGDPRSKVEAAIRSRGTQFFLHRLGCAVEQLDHLRASSRQGAMPESARREIAAHLERCRSLR